MISVTFDPYYIDDLQDYYGRNECIREQQYLSTEKLLHLAAFCVSKAIKDVGDETEQHGNGRNREVALDVVRQLSVLCENAGQVQVQLEPVIIVKGQTNQERHNDERHAMAMASKPVEKPRFDSMRLQSMASSVIDRSIVWLKFASKTPRN
jgi:hypothetical protein